MVIKRNINILFFSALTGIYEDGSNSLNLTEANDLLLFLYQKREDDLDNYFRTGYMVFNSCGTLCILLQVVYF